MLQRSHRRRWLGRLGLTNRPCSTGKECDPHRNCTKARSLVMLIGQLIIRFTVNLSNAAGTFALELTQFYAEHLSLIIFVRPFPCCPKGQLCRVWDGLHVSPRTAPSRRAKLCTYFAWFLRPSQLKTVPYFELPMPISRVRLLMQFRMGSHALPVEQGRLARPAVPRHLRRCTLCGTRALGDERHFVFDCPHFAHVRRQSVVVSRC